MVHNGDIQAVAVYDRDRLAAQGLQRLMFLSELKEQGIDLIICHGPPVLDGPEGQIVELALAVGKERQVLRARQGSRDGLHDRAALKRLPVTYHKLFGYQWDKTKNRLVPDGNYESVKLIFDLLLAGLGYGKIIEELQKRVVVSPSGQSEWNKTALGAIVHNPVYAGRYFALKKVAIPPTHRKTNSYGNSSTRTKPLSEALYLPEVEVVNPPITWEQRGKIIDQLAQHQKLSSRNAKHDYLLRGMVFCETHLSRNGDHRRYHGIPKHGSWYYACPVGGCAHPYVDGPWLENWVKDRITLLFNMKDDKTLEDIFGLRQKQVSVMRLTEELEDLLRKQKKGVSLEADLEYKNLNGELTKDSYQLVKARLHGETQWREERIETIEGELAALSRGKEAKDSLDQLKEKYAKHLGDLTAIGWRALLGELNVSVTVLEEPSPGKQALPPGFKNGVLAYVATVMSDAPNMVTKHRTREVTGDVGGWLEMGIGVPLDTAKLGALYRGTEGIVSVKPGRG